MGQKKGKVEERKLKCKQCVETFVEFKDLKGHWKVEHEGELAKVMDYIEKTKHVGDVNED